MFEFIKQLFNKSNEEPGSVLQKDAVILDVRTRQEYAQGHIEGSKNIPLNEIKLNTGTIRNWNKPVVTVCLSGGRSAAAAALLKAAGIDASNGGAWRSFQAKMQGAKS